MEVWGPRKLGNSSPTGQAITEWTLLAKKCRQERQPKRWSGETRKEEGIACYRKTGGKNY